LDKGQVGPPNLAQEIDFLDREYPEISNSSIILCCNSKLIKELSWNGIFQSTCLLVRQRINFLLKLQELGGVRLII
jgi:hypothetical protein